MLAPPGLSGVGVDAMLEDEPKEKKRNLQGNY